MYNRYVPQTDGTWKRNRVESPQRPPEPFCGPVVPTECPDTAEPVSSPPVASQSPQKGPSPRKSNTCFKNQPAGSFLRNLLPPDFDTGDLLVLLLLLLMAGDNPEDKNHALLTLAIYLFL